MDFAWLLSYVVYTLVVGGVIYWYLTKNYDYWKNVGIPFVPAVPIFGSHIEMLINEAHIVEENRYKKYGKIFGTYEGRRPVLNLADPDLLRNVLVKDFQIFPNRRNMAVGDDVSDKMVSVIRGEDWKRVRTLMTPAFSTGKIKKMVDIILDSAKTLGQNFHQKAKSGKPVDVKRIFGAFTMDVISSSAFATKINSHDNPENEFVVHARKIFSRNVNWRFIMLFLFPGLMKLFHIAVFSPEATKFFKEVTLQIIEERRRTGQKRNDFLQLLMEAAERSSSEEVDKEVEEEEDEKLAKDYGHEEGTDEAFKKTYRNKSMSYDELVAQCVIFFIAGYDTAASTLAFTVYQLALNPDIQEKVISEIDSVVKKNGGKLTYEAIQEMNYLDCVVSETLRYYPPAIRTERMAEEDYKLGDTGLVLPKGMIVGIPVYAIHHDPEYYPEPKKYNPDRFSTEEKAKRHPYAYLPFGAGPRNCVGMRFALMEVKICLSYIMSNFRFKRCLETKVPLNFFYGQGLLTPREVTLKIESRNDKVLNV